jgi:hypothetical protein
MNFIIELGNVVELTLGARGLSYEGTAEHWRAMQ